MSYLTNYFCNVFPLLQKNHGGKKNQKYQPSFTEIKTHECLETTNRNKYNISVNPKTCCFWHLSIVTVTFFFIS